MLLQVEGEAQIVDYSATWAEVEKERTTRPVSLHFSFAFSLVLYNLLLIILEQNVKSYEDETPFAAKRRSSTGDLVLVLIFCYLFPFSPILLRLF